MDKRKKGKNKAIFSLQFSIVETSQNPRKQKRKNSQYPSFFGWFCLIHAKGWLVWQRTRLTRRGIELCRSGTILRFKQFDNLGAEKYKQFFLQNPSIASRQILGDFTWNLRVNSPTVINSMRSSQSYRRAVIYSGYGYIFVSTNEFMQVPILLNLRHCLVVSKA